MSHSVAIVIVNWNGGDLLMRCLDSIARHVHACDLDVVVVDNASSDGSREAAAASFPQFRIIDSGANLGFGRANNLARSLVETSFVLFLNPDTELLPGCLDHALRCFRDRPDVGAVGCKMLEPDGKVQPLGLQWVMSPWTAFVELMVITERTRESLHRWLPVVDPGESCYVEKLYGGFLLVRREVLDRAGWFDERYFMYAEDADLSRTIRTLGWKLYYCADSVIVHVGGGVTHSAPSAFTYLMKQESINKLIRKYQGPAAAGLHRIAVCLGGLVRLTVVWLSGCVSGKTHTSASTSQWRVSLFKQQQLVLWSLGLRRASVPERRAGAR